MKTLQKGISRVQTYVNALNKEKKSFDKHPDERWHNVREWKNSLEKENLWENRSGWKLKEEEDAIISLNLETVQRVSGELENESLSCYGDLIIANTKMIVYPILMG